MSFEKKTWRNRIAEYINRRLLTKEDGSTELVTVARDEGTISQEGDAFNAANMNDLEDRIEAEFNEINQSLTNKGKVIFLGSGSENVTVDELSKYKILIFTMRWGITSPFYYQSTVLSTDVFTKYHGQQIIFKNVDDTIARFTYINNTTVNLTIEHSRGYNEACEVYGVV